VVDSTLQKPVNILLVEDNPEDAKQIQDLLKQSPSISFNVNQVDRLSKALNYLRKTAFDAIILDLSLPESFGLDTFLQIYNHAPDMAIIVIADEDIKSLAIEVIREGAQDYLIKKDLSVDHIVYSLLYAVERNRMRILLQQISFQDELTGLLNRRGFLSIAQQQFRIAQRENWGLLLVFADLDGLKEINDRFGHPVGDQALRTIGTILGECFRSSDVIARLGGDEFIVLAVNFANTDIAAIERRLKAKIDSQNAGNPRYQISLSYGVVRFDPRFETSLGDMISKADQKLYEHKKRKRGDSF